MAMTNQPREPFCLTCGKPNDGANGKDCAACEQWWRENNPDECKPDLIERLCNVAADNKYAIQLLFREVAWEVWPHQNDDYDPRETFFDLVRWGQFDQAAPMLVPEGCEYHLHVGKDFTCAFVVMNGPAAARQQDAKTPATALAGASLAAWRAMKGEG